MQALGPAVEPALDPGQAAKAGGSCQVNIRQAMAHLASPMPQYRLPRVPYTFWACHVLFGDLTEAVVQVCTQRQQDADPAIWGMAACFLLDQAKAFEYLSHDWIRQVVSSWSLPGWACAFLVSMAEGRRLIGNPRPKKPGRFLRRGVGMGGPASLFTWALCFEPVAWIAMVAAGCSNLLYVDDLLGKVRGPGQTLLLYMALLAATHTAGLKVEDHDCVTVYLDVPQRVVAQALGFPYSRPCCEWRRTLLDPGRAG